jgi:DNA-directed RNA polymerase specialized sigma24 family protein
MSQPAKTERNELVLMLRRCGRSYQEIADRLGLSISTVWGIANRQHRTKQRLRREALSCHRK